MRWINVCCSCVAREASPSSNLVRGPLSSSSIRRSEVIDVGQRRSHVVRHAMEQDFLFLNFGIQTLMGDDGFARALQDGLFRFERFAQPLEQQNAAGRRRSSPWLRVALPRRCRFCSIHGPDLARSAPPFSQHSSASMRKFSRKGEASASGRRCSLFSSAGQSAASQAGGEPNNRRAPDCSRAKRTKPSASSTA